MMGGAIKRAGIIGEPVAHSRSPLIHQFWLTHYHINGTYEKMRVSSDGLQNFIAHLPAQGFIGVNVTLPHKQTAFRFCDECDDMATRLGAVNVLSFKGGRISGQNTDGRGFLDHLRASAPQYKASGHKARPVLMLGAGGAARAIIAALADAGVREIRLANRTARRVADMRPLCAGTNCELIEIDWQARADISIQKDIGLLVNTTSLGMAGQPALDISLVHLPPDAIVADIVYAPLTTDLLSQAKQSGHICVDGLGMLLHQAAPAFAQWFGIMPDVTPALRRLIADDLIKGEA